MELLRYVDPAVAIMQHTFSRMSQKECSPLWSNPRGSSTALTAVVAAFFFLGGRMSYAANANLFVSGENSQFDNYMAGAQVIEVVVIDSDIKETDHAQGEPDVTINGETLRMSQAVDGNWYGYFADLESVVLADAMVVAPGTSLDFGRICGPDTNLSAAGQAPLGLLAPAAIAVPGATGGLEDLATLPHVPVCEITADKHMNVLQGFKSLNLSPTVSPGQIGLNPSAWPFIQLYSLHRTANVVVQYSRGGGIQTTTLTFDSVEPFISIEKDRLIYPRGADVQLAITDPALNIDPTQADSWTFATATEEQAGIYYRLFDRLGNQAADKVDNGTVDVRDFFSELELVDRRLIVNRQVVGEQSAVTLRDNNIAAIRSDDLEDAAQYSTDGGKGIVDGVPQEDPVVGALCAPSQPLTFLELGPNSGVFRSFDSNNQSGIRTIMERRPDPDRAHGIVITPRRGSSALVDYAEESETLFIGFTDAALALTGDSGDSGPWPAGQRRDFRLFDNDLNKNSLEDEDLDVFNPRVDSIPVIQVGNPFTLSGTKRASLGPLDLHVEVQPLSQRALLTHFGTELLEVVSGTELQLEHQLVDHLHESLYGSAEFVGLQYLHFDFRSLRRLWPEVEGMDIAVSDGMNSVILASRDRSSWFGLEKIERDALLALEGAEALTIGVTLHLRRPVVLRPGQVLPIVLDIFSFGFVTDDGGSPRFVNDQLARFEAEESGDNTGVFEAEPRYFTLNQLTAFDEQTYTSDPSFIEDRPDVILGAPLRGADALSIRYVDLNAAGVTATISHSEEVSTHSGMVRLDEGVYRAGDAVTVTLEDADLNQSRELFEVFGVVDPEIDDPASGTIGQSGHPTVAPFGSMGILMTVSFDGQLWRSDAACGGTILGADGLAESGFVLIETDKASGVFESEFVVPETFCHGATGEIRSTAGTELRVEYRDFLDKDGTYQVVVARAIVAAQAKIGLSDLRVIDSSGSRLKEARVEEEVQISARLQNDGPEEQSFAYIVQIENISGVIGSVNWLSGKLLPGASVDVVLPWVPKAEGISVIRVFIWDRVLGSPVEVLSPPFVFGIPVR